MPEWIAEWAVKLQEREYHAVLTAAVLAVAAVFGYTPPEAIVATIVGTLAVFVAFIINRAMVKKAQYSQPVQVFINDQKVEGVMVDGIADGDGTVN